MTSASPSSQGLDFRNPIETAIRQFVPWLAVVLLVTLVGNQPGVVCVTPLAWLIALRVGNICAAHSRSAQRSQRLTEAALGGALLGLLQGLLFAVVITQMEPISADDQARSITLTLILIAAGVFIGAGLSFFTAYLSEQRRQTS